MTSQNIIVVAGKLLLVDVIADALYFPLWWYTAGLAQFARGRARSVMETSENLALRLLLLNIFKPMFAQYDRVGRIISFFMRIVILVGRAVYFFLYCALQLAVLAAWILLPLFIFYRIVSIYAGWSIA